MLLFVVVVVLGGCKDGLSLRVVADGGRAAPDPDAARPAEADGDGGSLSDGDAGSVHRSDAATDGRTAEPTQQHWQPAPGTSWQWQLTGPLDTNVDVAMFDIDLFTSSPEDIADLHARGRRVVCYFDTAYEPDRPDEGRLRPYRGHPVEGWEGQNWVDIREPAVTAVMIERIQLAADKGCDGVEADDVDVASNDPGFPITREDQRAFIRKLAREAHARGLAYGLKNALEDIPMLIDEVDFAVNEQCFEFNECELLSPFIRAGKAVFHVEYPTSERESLESRARALCPRANALNFDSLIKYLDLDAPRVACR